MKNKVVILAAISFLFVGILASGCIGEKYDDNVKIVRKGTMTNYPNVPVGKAFDQFFSNGKWRSFTSTENQTIVEFMGNCTFNNKPAKMTVQFVVNPQNKTFMLKYASINDVPLNLLESAGVLDKILSEYKK